MKKFFFSNDGKLLLCEERDKRGHFIRMFYGNKGVCLAGEIICRREVDLTEINQFTFDFLKRRWNSKYTMILAIDDNAN